MFVERRGGAEGGLSVEVEAVKGRVDDKRGRWRKWIRGEEDEHIGMEWRKGRREEGKEVMERSKGGTHRDGIEDMKEGRGKGSDVEDVENKVEREEIWR